MKYINIIVEGSTEESFVNDVMVNHFAALDIFVSARKILTGWDKVKNKPAKGGLLQYNKLKKDIEGIQPEEINEHPQTAPSKRIIKYIPEYGNLKAQVGPLVAGDIGFAELRSKCPHFNEWINELENI